MLRDFSGQIGSGWVGWTDAVIIELTHSRQAGSRNNAYVLLTKHDQHEAHCNIDPADSEEVLLGPEHCLLHLLIVIWGEQREPSGRIFQIYQTHLCFCLFPGVAIINN